MRQTRALQGGGVLSHSTLFLVVTVCCLLLRIAETISFAISFPVVIVKGDGGAPECEESPIGDV